MAKLTITTGQLTAEVSTTDAKANAILSAYANAIGASGTKQEKLNAVAMALVRHMQEQSRSQLMREKQAAAVEAAKTEIDDLDWG